MDDDPLACTILGSWLGTKGYRATVASSPENADLLLGNESFDLILSDVCMPGNFRLEWVSGLLKREPAPTILLITGTPDLENACRAANLPVAGYLLKPFDFGVLEEVIRHIRQGQIYRRNLASLAKELIPLLTPSDAKPSPEAVAAARQLAFLSNDFQGRLSGPAALSRTVEDTWRAAIADTIAVLEKTKHSFRSKELGMLRLRLEQVLSNQGTP